MFATSAEDYPELPEKDSEVKISVAQPILKEMINQTKFAVAVTDIKPILKGELFEIEDGSLTLAAIDGYRLAVRYEAVKYDEAIKFVVPSKTLTEVTGLLSDNDDDSVNLYPSRKHIIFEIGGYMVYSRLLEGEFHPYKTAIPSSFNTEVIVDRKELISTLERAMLLINERTPAPVRCNFDNNTIKINCSTGLGKISDEMRADISGPAIEIGFKCKYLLDPLKVITEDKVKLQMGGSLLPMKIVPCEGDRYVYLVLPVRLPRD
jgi:DNA polymerase-3 subunit beta